MFGLDEASLDEFDFNKHLVRFLQHGNAIGEAILEAMPHEMIVFDSSRIIIRCNQRAKNFFRLETPKINGQTINKLDKSFEEIDENVLSKSSKGQIALRSQWVVTKLISIDSKNYYLLFR